VNKLAPFEWIAAIRFLKEGRMQTIFIVSGIALGVAVIIFMSALLTSLQTSFISRVLTSQPHIQISAPDEISRPLRPLSSDIVPASVIQQPAQRLRSIDQWQAITRELSLRSDVTFVAATISASGQALRGDASRSIAITGIDPATYFNIIKLPDYIILGEPRLTSEDIIIGNELAKYLGVTVGECYRCGHRCARAHHQCGF
jgi:lipoprotein-releasing system permease protein